MTDTASRTDAEPRRLGWLRPPKSESPDGTMSLWDHLREVRYRVTISVIALVLAAVAGIFFYQPLMLLVMRPYLIAKGDVESTNDEALLQLANNGVTGPFTLAVVTLLLAGVIVTTPVWMYQIWAFVAPGLVAKEKKYAAAFLGAAIPLFLAGCAIGYWVWPKGIAVMLSFTPRDLGVMNLQDMSEFIMLEVKIILVFGLSFLLPVVMVTLNVFGIVKGYQLAKARKFVIFGSFVFAAIATPSTDPFSMLALSVPVSILFMVAEVICKMLDKRKGITAETAAEWQIDVDDEEETTEKAE